MKFTEFHIDGFGKFNDFSLPSLQEGVNIIAGENEAGKSTLLKFIRFTLFGYPRRKKKRMKPLNGGEHGGRIKAINTSDKLTFERYSGSNGGDKNLYKNGSEVKENVDQTWNSLLGEADKNLYKNVYSFSLQELVDFESLSESGVEDKIFSIGLGLGDKSINSIRSNIEETAGKIYNPRGSTQKVYKLLDRLKEQKDEVNEIKNNLNKYQDLTREKQKTKQKIKKNEQKLQDLRAEKNKIKGALDSYDSFVKIKQSEEKLQELSDKKEVDKTKQEIDQLKERREKLNEEKKELKKGSRGKPGVEQLKEKLDSIDLNQAILDRESEVEFIKKNLEKYKQTKQDKKENEQKITEINQRIDIKLGQLNSNWDEDDVIDFSDIIKHEDKVKNFKKKLEHIKDRKRELQSELKAIRSQNTPSTKHLMLVIGFVCIAVAGSSFYYTAYTRAISFVVASLIAFGAYLLTNKTEGKEFKQELEKLEQKENQIKHDYEHYLVELGLEQSLSPDGVIDIFSTTKNLKERIKEKQQLEEKQQKERQPFLDEFKQKVNNLKSVLDKENFSNEITQVAENIITELEENKDKQQQRNQLKEKLEQTKEELSELKDELAEVNRTVQNLVKLSEASSLENVKQVIETNEQRKELKQNKQQAQETIEQIVGFEKSSQVIDFLEGRDKQQLQAKITELKQEITELEDDIEQKNSRLGEINQQLQQTAGESELAEEMTKLESLKQQLDNSRKDWLASKLSLEILSEVKEKYEQEKQPEVIQKSSNYFRKITSERYDRINVSLDDQEISIYDSKEATKNINQLSRGTKEQLLLTLRLGFIEEYEQETEPLPAVMDEVFVNFDPSRAKKTAGIISEFAQGRQVLIFTCHPQTINLFSDEANVISL